MPQTSITEAPNASFQGMQGDARRSTIESYVNEEASAEMAFGIMVKQGTGDKQCKLLAAQADVPIGIVCHFHAFQKDHELGATGLKPGVTVPVMTKGELWVPVEEAVTPASAVKYRAVVAGAEVAGAFRDTADGTDCVDISKFARFKSTTTGAGLALLEFDMTMRDARTSDT